jgi:hypothetical protein
MHVYIGIFTDGSKWRTGFKHKAKAHACKGYQHPQEAAACTWEAEAWWPSRPLGDSRYEMRLLPPLLDEEVVQNE